MLRRSLLRSRIGLAVVVMAAALAGTVAAATGTTAAPRALAMPTPLEYTSHLDLECFRTNPYTPPQTPIMLSHLNPVLAQQFGRWTVAGLGQRSQLCTPVAKNGKLPPQEVLPFIAYTDLSCYRIGGPNVNFPLVVSHLNPQLGHLPRREVTMMAPEQLCVPVIKNDSVPPAEVRRLIQFIDLVCYREAPQASLNQPLNLTQLNPVLSHLPKADVLVNRNRQLCVPVRKNEQEIPDEVLRIVQWIDLEKFDIGGPTLPAVNLKLRHINPLLANLPVEEATLTGRHQLALPVAKNGHIPPG